MFINPFKNVLFDFFLSINLCSFFIFWNFNPRGVIIEIGWKITVSVTLAVIAKEMINAVFYLS
jgi:hypothetical protein